MTVSENSKRRKTLESEIANIFLTTKQNSGHLLTGNRKIEDVYIDDRHFSVTTNLYNFSPTGVLHYCGVCLQSFNSKFSLERHSLKCSKCIYSSKKVYEEGNTAVYKVEGDSNPSFCQSLCILGRCFIDNKTLYLDIDNYNFYILFNSGQFVGYFSDEHFNEERNLSCILILPDQQRKGFGTLMVDLSYHFKRGTPEKPFSPSGSILYNHFWKSKVNEYLLSHSNESKSLVDISNSTNLTVDDVIIGLELLGVDLNNTNELISRKSTCRFADKLKIIKD